MSRQTRVITRSVTANQQQRVFKQPVNTNQSLPTLPIRAFLTPMSGRMQGHKQRESNSSAISRGQQRRNTRGSFTVSPCEELCQKMLANNGQAFFSVKMTPMEDVVHDQNAPFHPTFGCW